MLIRHAPGVGALQKMLDGHKDRLGRGEELDEMIRVTTVCVYRILDYSEGLKPKHLMDGRG